MKAVRVQLLLRHANSDLQQRSAPRVGHAAAAAVVLYNVAEKTAEVAAIRRSLCKNGGYVRWDAPSHLAALMCCMYTCLASCTAR
jgi:hypothetical protein